VAASFSSALDGRLPPRLNVPARQTVHAAKRTPLVVVRPKPGAIEPRRLEAAERDASVTAFHAGVIVSALLTFAGGLIALAGIRNPRRVEAPARAPAPAAGRPAPAAAGADGSGPVEALRSGILEGPCPPGCASTHGRTSSSPR
jgi:hypothetical protein